MSLLRHLSASLLTAALAATAALTACQDTVDTIGSDLIDNRVAVVIDSAFTVNGRSVANDSVQSRTTTQLLGSIRAHNYGTLTSDFVTEMLPANVIDTVGINPLHPEEQIDSVKLLMIFYKNGFVGDSVVPMGVEVYPLSKPLPYPIYSAESPAGYYDPSSSLGSSAYSAVGIGINDTVAALSYRYIYVPLPRQMGVDLYRKYLADPTLFSDPTRFATEFFHGFYVKTSFGSGRVTRITDTRWVMYYHRTERLVNKQGEEVDSLVNYAQVYMASAPEVVANSHIRLSLDATVQQRVARGEQLLVSPAGLDVELQFPTQDLIKSYREKSGDRSVVNTLSFSIPATAVDSDRDIAMPQNVLLVLSSQKKQFFADNKLPDSRTSFYGRWVSADSAYVFDDMHEYLIDMLAKPTVGPDDYTFTITPIELETETSSSYWVSTSTSVNAVTPMVSVPAMAQLNLGDAKIKLTFSLQNIK